MLAAAAAAASLGGAGCASDGYDRGYGYERHVCGNCGVVRDIEQVYVRRDHATLGTVIGALVGGALGNQVGKGDGRKAATVAGAVAGGAIGQAVGERNGTEESAWRIEVRLDDGRLASVTQREPPAGIREGDYVEIRNDRVYRLR
ncbi:hypothetical protein MBSD_n2638 [Mizugakiibacter sediminis]|uniref:Membrane protein n=2 Tax=Mizugakiibacter sediminis TaxID=1475481 RepID=A0A0K8QSE1_9GAMM|nr:hypothetical protein MBSD_n2638 [Mizugakiibacter sediminis]